MQLQSRDGIACDFCGTKHIKEFTYYSIDIRDAQLQQGHTIPIEIIRRNKIAFSFDICPACYGTLTQTVIQNYRPVNIGVVCDLTGQELNDSNAYHYVDITRVKVKVPPTGKADITITPRDLELIIADAACTNLIDRVLTCRKAATKWQTSST